LDVPARSPPGQPLEWNGRGGLPSPRVVSTPAVPCEWLSPIEGGSTISSTVLRSLSVPRSQAAAASAAATIPSLGAQGDPIQAGYLLRHQLALSLRGFRGPGRFQCGCPCGRLSLPSCRRGGPSPHRLRRGDGHRRHRRHRHRHRPGGRNRCVKLLVVDPHGCQRKRQRRKPTGIHQCRDLPRLDEGQECRVAPPSLRVPQQLKGGGVHSSEIVIMHMHDEDVSIAPGIAKRRHTCTSHGYRYIIMGMCVSLVMISRSLAHGYKRGKSRPLSQKKTDANNFCNSSNS
jgi:hypothetical protein